MSSTSSVVSTQASTSAAVSTMASKSTTLAKDATSTSQGSSSAPPASTTSTTVVTTAVTSSGQANATSKTAVATTTVPSPTSTAVGTTSATATPTTDGKAASSASPKAASTTPAAISPVKTSVLVSKTVLAGGQTSTFTTTSTITPSPQSTFSSPVPIVVTNSSNGEKSTVFPAVVTTDSVSTEPNGSITTITYVVANPTAVFGSQSIKSSGFFSNHGAVAGVFVIIGLVFAAFATFLVLCLRRRRSRTHRQRLRTDISWPRPIVNEDMPGDSHDPPMTAATWGGRTGHLFDDRLETGTGVAARSASEWPRASAVEDRRFSGGDPFDDHHQVHRQSLSFPIGVAVTTPDPPQMPIHSSRSSPSLYAASQHTDESASIQEQPRSSPADAHEPPRHSDSSTEMPSKSISYQPLTPPASVSSHLPSSKPPSPTEESNGASLHNFLDDDVNGEAFKGQLKRMLSNTLINPRPRPEAALNTNIHSLI
ncbi:hypothetical protein PLICRDRAFT_414714 [Plicaturopsis crispa FD-325 SS-3]|nr:hypothetical protein PLICRDRAFT_414714 [Plicaturopsis crispa FD-325 SS-3]